MIPITTESIKGQRVLIKTWKQLKKEFGKNEYGDIDTSIFKVTKYMKSICGTIQQLNMESMISSYTITPEMVQEIIPSCPEPEQPIKWEPKGGDWFVDMYGDAAVDTLRPYRLTGQYQTKQQAEWAAKQMRCFNRILAWLSEQPEQNNDEWTVYFSDRKNKYIATCEDKCKDIGTVYMSEANANLLAQQLNDGIVEL